MKIAICISGHIRNLSIISVLDNLSNAGIDYDVFISSWNTNGQRLGMYDHNRTIPVSFDNINIKNIIKCEVEDDLVKLSEIYDICELYKDVIEPGNYVSEFEIERKYQILSMFRKCQRSIDLVDGQYDLILRTRFDCYFDVNIVLWHINNLINNNLILLPNTWSAGDESHPGGGRICDSFAIGTYDKMKKYSKIYDFLSEKTTPEYLLNNEVWFCPHSLLRHHLLLNDVSYIKDNINYNVIR